MSFHRWLQKLRSALTASRSQRRRVRRGALRGTTHRAHLEVLEDRSLPSFSPVTSFPVDSNPQAVVMADFNNDLNLDLATMHSTSNTVSVLLGDGRGGFGAANHVGTGTGPRSMAVGDFDNDGRLDLATVNDLFAPISDNLAELTILRGNGDGTFQPPINIDIAAVPLSVAAGDFNADGNTDLAYTFDSFDFDAVEVLLGDGRGGFAAADFQQLQEAYQYAVGLAVADLNADGTRDLVTANEYADTVSVLLGKGDGTFSYDWSSSHNFAAGLSPRAVAVGDFTGDGILDLVTVGQTVDVLPGHGDGSFDPAISQTANGSLHTGVAVADFNGDGKLDVVASDADTGTVSLLLGNGNGTLTLAGAYAVGSSTSAVVVGDFNGDSRTDVAAANGGSNTVSVLLNDGAWTSPPPSVRISDVVVSEGNAGTASATFSVTLSAASTQPITVAYATADGTATAGSDYQAASATLTIPAGQITGTITVVVNGDRLGEADETFFVVLSSPTNASIADGQGVGTIVDDEPRISISDVTKAEGKKNQTTLFTFTVTLSAAYDQTVTMSFQTANGTATSGDNDYIAKTGTLTFRPGETTKTITIEVKGDSKKEADETFYLDLFGLSSNALFTKNRGIGKILNDD